MKEKKIISMMKRVIEMSLRNIKRNFRSIRSREEITLTATTTSVSIRSLKTLHKFYDDEKAKFKSSKQIKALQLIMNAKTDILAILSIDGGKSLLFFLSTLMESRMMTMMIISLIAMINDLRNRCMKTNIS